MAFWVEKIFPGYQPAAASRKKREDILPEPYRHFEADSSIERRCSEISNFCRSAFHCSERTQASGSLWRQAHHLTTFPGQGELMEGDLIPKNSAN